MTLMRKVSVGFFAYALLIIVYFALQSYETPASFAGTPADPATFLTPEELDEAFGSAWIRDAYSFIYPVLQCYVLFLFYSSGIAGRLTDRFSKHFRKPGAVFLAFLVVYVTYRISMLPVRFGYFLYRTHLGLTKQPTASWMYDRLLDIGVGVCTEFAAVLVIWWFIRRFGKRWWAFIWALSVPVIFLFVYAKPVWIDPLYNNYTSIKDAELKAAILELAGKAGIPATDVYEADVSKQTTTINAYVNGIGSSLRIVLWDTALQKLNEREILSILAHEMGHYKLGHVLRGTMYALAGALGFFAMTAWLWRWYRKRSPDETPNHFVALMLLISLLLFLSTPISSRLSHGMEVEADDYAARLVRDPEASITLHQKLAKYSKALVDEPWLSRFFYGTHPTIRERIVEDMRRLEADRGQLDERGTF